MTTVRLGIAKVGTRVLNFAIPKAEGGGAYEHDDDEARFGKFDDEGYKTTLVGKSKHLGAQFCNSEGRTYKHHGGEACICRSEHLGARFHKSKGSRWAGLPKRGRNGLQFQK